MHDVTVTLDGTIRVDPDGTGARDPAEIVAGKIDQHHVFGRLLRVRQQRLLVGDVFLAGRAARQRAGDRPQRRPAVIQLHQRFGRRADDLQVVEVEIKHVRRRV